MDFSILPRGKSRDLLENSVEVRQTVKIEEFADVFEVHIVFSQQFACLFDLETGDVLYGRMSRQLAELLAADESATHIAHFASSGYPAVSVKECDGYTSVFYGSKTINEDVIREMARFAGVHVFCDSNDVTCVGANYITFHASSSGKKTLRFSKPTTVYEVYEKKTYAQNATEVEFDAYFGETKMFRYM